MPRFPDHLKVCALKSLGTAGQPSPHLVLYHCASLQFRNAMPTVGESGAHSCMGHIRFQQFMGTRVTARAQGKLWKYVYHCRPSFTVEDNTVPAVMLDKNANL